MKTALLIFLTIGLTVGCSRESPPAVAETAEKATERAPGADITAEAAKTAGVEIAVAGSAMLRESLVLYGNIQPDAEHVRTVTARYPDIVRSVAHQIGDRVVAGQTLATVESNESLQTYAVSSPISGVITQRHTNPGEVAGSEPLFEIADFSMVRAELSVFPKDRSRLKIGQKASVHAAEGALSAEGVVTYLAPLGSLQNQSISARMSLPNRDGRWTPGQFVTADVVVDEAPAAITVAPGAIQQIKGMPTVFVQSDRGFDARSVEIGRRASDVVEVKSGLRAGERYVAKNSFLVKAEVLKSEAAKE